MMNFCWNRPSLALGCCSRCNLAGEAALLPDGTARSRSRYVEANSKNLRADCLPRIHQAEPGDLSVRRTKTGSALERSLVDAAHAAGPVT